MQEGQVRRGVLSAKFIVLIVLIVAAIAGGIIYKGYRDRVARSPETFGKQFVTALTQKDGGTTYAMFSDAAKKQLSNDEWNQWVVFTFDKYSGGEPQLVKKETVPDPSEQYGKGANPTNLDYQFTFDGKDYKSRITMIQTGDTWKVAEVGALR